MKKTQTKADRVLLRRIVTALGGGKTLTTVQLYELHGKGYIDLKDFINTALRPLELDNTIVIDGMDVRLVSTAPVRTSSTFKTDLLYNPADYDSHVFRVGANDHRKYPSLMGNTRHYIK